MISDEVEGDTFEHRPTRYHDGAELCLAQEGSDAGRRDHGEAGGSREGCGGDGEGVSWR